MDYITAFSQKYLNKCGQILENEILSDGNCFYHSLEYANADCDLDPLYRDIINSRKRICQGIIDQIKRVHGVTSDLELPRAARLKAKEFEDMKETKEWTQDECEVQGAVDKQKDLFIITRNTDEPIRLQDIRLIRPRGRENLPFERNKMLFLIHLVHNTDVTDNMGVVIHKVATGVHFITFHRESWYEPIEPNDDFLDRINRYKTSRGFTEFYEDRLDSDGVVTYRFHIDNFDPDLKTGLEELPRNRNLGNVGLNNDWEDPAGFGNEPTSQNPVKQSRVSDNNYYWKSQTWVPAIPYHPLNNNELPKNTSEALRQNNNMFGNFNLGVNSSSLTKKVGKRNPTPPRPKRVRVKQTRSLSPGAEEAIALVNAVKSPPTRKIGKPPVPRGVRVKVASPKNRTPSPGAQEAINLAKALEMSEKGAKKNRTPSPGTQQALNNVARLLSQEKKNRGKPGPPSFKLVKGLPLGVNAPKSLKQLKPRVAKRVSAHKSPSKSASPGAKQAVALVNAVFGTK